MQFKLFKTALQNNIARLIKHHTTLYVMDVDKDLLWETYLKSFPEGTNLIFRKRSEHDCSCCRQFIKNFGNVVAIVDNVPISIWDFDTKSAIYGPVAAAMTKLLYSSKIQNVFVTKELAFGTDRSHEMSESGKIFTWEHFHVVLPKAFKYTSSESVASVMGDYRSSKEVFARSLTEISQDALETVLELIAQNSLYKGEEWQAPLKQFLILHKEYHKLPTEKRDAYCWTKSISVGPGLSRIKNHSIGVLLSDIADGMELDDAVRRYEKIVAPTNYKRPKAIFTKKMVEQAERSIMELGLLDSLRRRYATLEDITINNILFANKDVAKRISGSVFDEMKVETAVSPKAFDKVEQITIENFVNNILPHATSLEAFVENGHKSNLVSLIAPEVKDSKTLFKWENNFSWAYTGNITDSMKERVKAAGGTVDGVLRFSIQWNEDGDNPNDFDAHCIEPNNKNHINYTNKRKVHASSGMLDVDIIHPAKEQVAVENIIYTSLHKMPKGVYKFYVNTFSNRGGNSGFSAEIEFNGEIYSFEHRITTKTGENVEIAKIELSDTGFRFVTSMASTTSSTDVWGIKTNQFHPVSVCMFSPNYWDNKKGVGNKHYFFMLNQCKNDGTPNGFFNEFLKEEFNPHKRVFEALGGKMKVAETSEQLSGLGFSSTKRNSLICKVSGKVARVVKIVF